MWGGGGVRPWYSMWLTQLLPGNHPERKAVFQPLFFRCYASFKEGRSWANFLVEGATSTVAYSNCVSCSSKTKTSNLQLTLEDANTRPICHVKLLKTVTKLLPIASNQWPNTLPLSSPSVLAALHSVAPGQWHSGRPRLWPFSWRKGFLMELVFWRPKRGVKNIEAEIAFEHDIQSIINHHDIITIVFQAPPARSTAQHEGTTWRAGKPRMWSCCGCLFRMLKTLMKFPIGSKKLVYLSTYI